MSDIERIALQLENTYAPEGPAAKTNHSLNQAEGAILGAQQVIAQVGEGSAQSTLPEVGQLYEKALAKIQEARLAVTNAIIGAAAVRSRVLGENTGVLGAALAAQQTVPGFSAPSVPTHVRVMHRTSQGIYLARHPDHIIQAETEASLAAEIAKQALCRDFVDNAPNLNERYAEEIELVRQYYAAKGHTIPPIVVLDQEHFAQYRRMDDPKFDSAKDSVLGQYAYERIVARPFPNPLAEEVFGNQMMVGIMIHEAGHSLGETGDLMAASSERGDQRIVGLTPRTGFAKIRSSDCEQDGFFFEEGIAETHRVEGLITLGNEPHIIGRAAIKGTNHMYVGEDVTPELPSFSNDVIEIPARYALAAKPIARDNNQIADSPSGPAAYGLELIANEIPGARDIITRAQYDPAAQRQLIKAIEGIEPGLYASLRNLYYNHSDFDYGLRRIGDAIRYKREQS